MSWAFTLSNAGAYYFKDRADLNQLDEIKWDAVLRMYCQFRLGLATLSPAKAAMRG